MKKKSRIEIAREIISNLKIEMQRPRLTASVRESLSAQAAPSVEEPSELSTRG